MKPIETERLTLRLWNASDFDTYAAMCADPEVMRFLGPRRPLLRFEAWQTFASLIGHWHLRGFGMFAVVERTSGEVIGRIGPWEPEGWPEFEIGWTLRPSHWGKGYATEAVRASIQYAFSELGRQHLISIIDPENIRSIAVATRVGEKFEGKLVIIPHPDKTFLQYGLKREDWPGL
jgi:RimJ/RimL family protein N-acetyltransferase